MAPAKLYVLIARSGCARRDDASTGIRTSEECAKAVMAIEAAVLPLTCYAAAIAATQSLDGEIKQHKLSCDCHASKLIDA
jgi:hypothetical protein